MGDLQHGAQQRVSSALWDRERNPGMGRRRPQHAWPDAVLVFFRDAPWRPSDASGAAAVQQSAEPHPHQRGGVLTAFSPPTVAV
eukprot:CAMPEP_0202819256 /NCGR_PEP_ID=MMETSP1389-20130828/8963_1 /ASSEMBLY_ACC=CAM_ASM_000865 /TAXON_ID=302021 /ORGANISM="Rhodomonas sp., Strain CCMP768" /LENGTH=83 /DNA_ID=CAMNT_0049491777 /DNA_START=11 /DNA_END=259 /DNA_ORIENTATION=-